MKWLVVLSCLLTTTAFAQTIPQILNRVSQDKDLMPRAGKYKNQTVENGQRRTITFLTKAEKEKLGIKPDIMAFANFRHNGQFFIATIDGMKTNSQGRPTSAKSLVEKIVLSKKHWAGKTRPETKEMEVHAELLFYFKKDSGINLIFNQNTQSALSKPQTLANVVLSIEAIRSSKAEKAPFFPDALGPNFAIGHRIVSLYERNMQHKDDPERTITSYRFTMNDTRSKRNGFGPSEALLAGSLEKSNDLGRRQAYHIITNNCTNNIFNVLDENITYNQSRGNRIDYSLIKQDIVDFVNKDLDAMLNFLENMAEKNQNVVDKETRELLRKYVVEHSLSRASDIDMSKVSSPDNLMYQVPAFIDGHLRARGLLK
jgi:hypothetical protein